MIYRAHGRFIRNQNDGWLANHRADVIDQFRHDGRGVADPGAGIGADQCGWSGLMSGKNVSLHQVMISMEEANISFQMMVEVRNKLLDSYQELMRMQV